MYRETNESVNHSLNRLIYMKHPYERLTKMYWTSKQLHMLEKTM